MIYIDDYDREILRVIRKNPGISLFDLRDIVGRPCPLRKRMKRLTDLGVIEQRTPRKKTTIQTAQKLYLNEKLVKETVCINNKKQN
jgi:DNA-binding Lrp family transcriptional regulator